MITHRKFGELDDKTEVTLFCIDNGEARAELLDYGARVRCLSVPNRFNEPQNVVLGYGDVYSYEHNDGYFGATVGRYANRIKNASFEIEDVKYELDRNEGENTLHGGKCGFDKRMWAHEALSDNSIKFTYISPDKEGGFPGELSVSVIYSLTGKKLTIKYIAKTDKPTYINLTNHIYFNLSGEKTIREHELKLYSSCYTQSDASMIPTGEILPVKNTPFEFSVCRRIGNNLDAEALKYSSGYDCNYVLSKEAGLLAAALKSEKSGITMNLYTTQPALMVYTGNYITPRKGLNSEIYGRYKGVCLEPQHFPDSPHNSDFPSTLLLPEETYEQISEYAFTS